MTFQPPYEVLTTNLDRSDRVFYVTLEHKDDPPIRFRFFDTKDGIKVYRSRNDSFSLVFEGTDASAVTDFLASDLGVVAQTV